MTVNSYAPATMHRPVTRDGLRVAAVELMQRGLTPCDLAPVLGLTPQGVATLVTSSQEVHPS